MGYCLGNNYACCRTLKSILFKYLLLVAFGRRPSCNVSSIYEFPKTDLNILYRPSQLRDHLLNLLLFRFGFVNSWLTISNLDGVAPFIEHQSSFASVLSPYIPKLILLLYLVQFLNKFQLINSSTSN